MRLLLPVLSVLLGGCRDQAPRPAPAPPAPPAPSAAAAPAPEDEFDEDDMVPLARLAKRIEREGPPGAAATLRLADQAGGPLPYGQLGEERHVGRPYLLTGRLVQLRPGDGGTMATLELGRAGRERVMLACPFPVEATVGRRAEAVGYLAGTLPDEAGRVVPAMAVRALLPEGGLKALRRSAEAPHQ